MCAAFSAVQGAYRNPYQVCLRRTVWPSMSHPFFFLEWRFSWFMDPVIRNLSAVIDTEPYGFQRVSILGLITSTVGLGADIMSWVR